MSGSTHPCPLCEGPLREAPVESSLTRQRFWCESCRRPFTRTTLLGNLRELSSFAILGVFGLGAMGGAEAVPEVDGLEEGAELDGWEIEEPEQWGA